MFRITEDPSSGSLVQCLAKNYKNDCIVSVVMDKVGIMAAYCNLMCVRVVNYTHTHIRLQSAAVTPTTSMSTDTIEPFL